MDKTINPDIEPKDMTGDELVAYFTHLKSMAEMYRRSEEALRLDEARLEALLKLNDMAMASEAEIIAYALEEAISLTGSKIGWMGALSPDERTLAMHCWSAGVKRDCGILERSHALNVSDGGIWIEPLLQKKPVVVNDYASSSTNSVPCGHVPVSRFLGLPVYDGSRIVAVAEVGNKDTDYDSSDVRQLTLLMGGVWRIIMRKRVEDALSESKAQAELYVDFMGHDINNMNQVAMGFLELAVEKLDSSGKLEKDDVGLLEKPIETMRNSAKLIDNVKKLQRLRNGELQPMLLDIDNVLADAKSEVICDPGRQVCIDFSPEPGRRVKANELLKDVFSNILDNAIKHSGPEKPLSICIRVSTTDNVHRISIEDDGPGIPDRRKGEIFDRLSYGKMKALRTGLGLGLVKTLVESYHGRIWVEDRVQGDYRQGCRFIVELPEAGPRM